MPVNLQIGLRLRDAAGTEWAASDTQLAYGFYPSAMAGGRGRARLLPAAFAGRHPPGHYTLDLSLYDPATRARLGALTLPAHITTATPRGERAAAVSADARAGPG